MLETFIQTSEICIRKPERVHVSSSASPAPPGLYQEIAAGSIKSRRALRVKMRQHPTQMPRVSTLDRTSPLSHSLADFTRSNRGPESTWPDKDVIRRSYKVTGTWQVPVT